MKVKQHPLVLTFYKPRVYAHKHTHSTHIHTFCIGYTRANNTPSVCIVSSLTSHGCCQREKAHYIQSMQNTNPTHTKKIRFMYEWVKYENAEYCTSQIYIKLRTGVPTIIAICDYFYSYMFTQCNSRIHSLVCHRHFSFHILFCSRDRTSRAFIIQYNFIDSIAFIYSAK